MLSDVLSYMNTTFTLFFTIECILKLISFGGRVKNFDDQYVIVFCPCPEVQDHVVLMYRPVVIVFCDGLSSHTAKTNTSL